MKRSDAAGMTGLTAKQRELLILLGAGYDRHEAAQRLGISLGAVATRLDTAFARQGARNLPHLLAIAVWNGDLKPSDLLHAHDRRNYGRR